MLAFPYIFRGALDTHATAINGAMELAATRAIAALAKQPVPDYVNEATGRRASPSALTTSSRSPSTSASSSKSPPPWLAPAIESGVAPSPPSRTGTPTAPVSATLIEE